MFDDSDQIRAFYASRQGHALARTLAPHVDAFWGAARNTVNVSFGFGVPFMTEKNCRVGFMPMRQGAIIWPKGGPVRTGLIDPHCWPMPDVLADRLLLIHALEYDSNPARLLGECWRVLDGAGRIMVVVPHRHGMWARAEKTPFGHGRPYSRRQLRQLLSSCGFEVRQIRSAVFTLPTAVGWTLQMAPTIERIGSRFWPALGGVLLASADKMLYAPAGKTSKLRAAKGLKPVRLAPQSGSAFDALKADTVTCHKRTSG